MGDLFGDLLSGGYLLEHTSHLSGLPEAGPGHFDQPLVGRPVNGFSLLCAPKRHLGDLVRPSLGAAGAVPKRFTFGRPPNAFFDEALRLADQTAYDPHPIDQKRIIGGIMDVGLDHRAVGSELATARNFQRAGQLDGALVERLKRFRPDQVGPADEGCVLGSALQIQATELPQADRITDEMLGLLVASSVEPFDHQSIRRMTSTGVEW